MAYTALINNRILPNLPDDTIFEILSYLGPPKRWSETAMKDLSTAISVYKPRGIQYPIRVLNLVNYINEQWRWDIYDYQSERQTTLIEEMDGSIIYALNAQGGFSKRWLMMIYGLSENAKYRFGGKHCESYKDD